MTGIITIIIWILTTLTITYITAIIGKKYGVEYIIAVVASCSVIANILANKIVSFGTFTVPAGILIFSSIFMLTDILSELWGKEAAKKAVWSGFISNIILVVSIWIAVSWNSPTFLDESAKMFSSVLGLTPRIVLGSLVAYILSQNHDIWAFHFWKTKTQGKHLWLRNNASTAVSQLIDSTIFIVIAFYGILPIVPLILGQYIIKLLIAILDTPFIYLAVNRAKKIN